MNRIVRLVAATALAALGLVLIVDASHTQGRRGAPTAVTSPPAVATNAPAAHANSGAAAGPKLMRPGPVSTARVQSSAAQPDRELSGPFRLVVRTDSVTINVPVAPFSVTSHQPVDPPHNTARQWNTAAWIRQSTFPTQPSRGTAYIYGHACQYIVCSFNNLKSTRVGNSAQIITRTARMTYRVDRIGLSPKTATSLPHWASDSTVPNRIVLVTCSYQEDGASPDNLVVVGHLVHGPARQVRTGTTPTRAGT